MASPADAIANLLPNTIVDGVTGWLLRIGKLPDTPNQVVVFYDSGGSNPNPKWRVDYSTIQVRIRGIKSDYSGAYDKAREIRDHLLGIDSQALGSDWLVSLTVMGDIGFTGYDDNDRPEFTINFRTIIEPASGANRESL